MTQTALLFGVSGQIGSYLCELLLEKGYKVYGVKRRSSSINTERIDHLYQDPHVSDRFELFYGDITDAAAVCKLIGDLKPDLCFNLAAQSHVKVSFDLPLYTMETTGNGVLNCLEAIRNYSPKTRFLQMSSSEMFGSTAPPQCETTPFHPRSPYAVAKLMGYYATINYREAYGLFASNAISFNSESSRRGSTFATRKLTLASARIKVGLQDKVYMGNLSAQRDWIFAGDSADGILKILEHNQPDDFVLGSGQMYSIEYFAEKAFGLLGLNHRDHIEIDPKYFRPTEVDALCADASKIRRELNWNPSKSIDQIIEEMVMHDLKLAQQEKLIKDHSAGQGLIIKP